MICYINRSTVEYDIRLYKYVQACKNTNTSYFVIGWDRLLNAKWTDEQEYQMKLYCPYSQGKRLIPLLRWMIFVWYYLIKNFDKYKVIHACNMENALLALPFKLLGKKVIFDVYDSQLIIVERKIIPLVDMLILPHKLRLESIGISLDKVRNLFIVENVPAIDYVLKPLSVRNDDKIHLSYVGTFQKRIRGIENLLDFVRMDDRFILDIAGTGDDLDEYIKECSQHCNRIIFHGKVLYQDALEIMHNSDYIVALYYTCVQAHIYASPNKYHESLFLGRPIITSKNSLVGTRTEQSNTGYVVDDTLEGLKSVFDGYGTPNYQYEYDEKCRNCIELWTHDYKDYRVNKLDGDYINSLYSIVGKSTRALTLTMNRGDNCRVK